MGNTDSIPCKDCEHAYIEQTKRHFGTRLKEHQKAVFLCKKENSALSERACHTNHKIGWNNSEIITTNRRNHQRLCLEAWHKNSAHAPLNRDDGDLSPDSYLHPTNLWLRRLRLEYALSCIGQPSARSLSCTKETSRKQSP